MPGFVALHRVKGRTGTEPGVEGQRAGGEDRGQKKEDGGMVVISSQKGETLTRRGLDAQ